MCHGEADRVGHVGGGKLGAIGDLLSRRELQLHDRPQHEEQRCGQALDLRRRGLFKQTHDRFPFGLRLEQRVPPRL